MPSKSVVMFLMFIGSLLGSYALTLVGVGAFSLWSLVGSFIGGALGIYFAFKLFSQ